MAGGGRRSPQSRIGDKMQGTGTFPPCYIHWYGGSKGSAVLLPNGGCLCQCIHQRDPRADLVEALSSGLPAICRKDDCLQGVISNGKNGWQYETAEEFFDALEILFPESLVHRQKITGWEYEMCSINARQSVVRFSTDEFGTLHGSHLSLFEGSKRRSFGEKNSTAVEKKGLAALRK